MGGGHAHHVIVDRGGHRVWSQERGAWRLYADLLRGPVEFPRFVRTLPGGTPDFWMNSVRWQGVVLVDLPRRRLFVHSTAEIAPNFGAPCDLPEIRAWLGMLRQAWSGWEVAWIARGLYEVMDRLGLPYPTVAYLDDPPRGLARQWALAPTEDDDPGRVGRVLCAVRSRDGALSFAGSWARDMADHLCAGPDAHLRSQHDVADFTVLESVPWSGLHLDAPNRRLDWWSLDTPLDPARLPQAWEGWTLTDHGDAYEDVVRLIGPELLIDAGDEHSAARRLTERITLRR
ncbi:hypothetical protein [Embleya sp. NPDC050493]|uniref:hypothetical protein n=1 Tax=Embleya sp. NPDC050493 TaxID=3363989 RepID=UPI0037B95521